MNLKNYQLDLFQKTGSSKPERLVWTDTSSREQEGSRTVDLDPSSYRKFGDYQVIVAREWMQNNIDDLEKDRLLKNGKEHFDDKEKAVKEKSEDLAKYGEIKNEIEDFREKKNMNKKAKEAIAEIEADNIKDLKDLRKWVLSEMKEFGIDVETSDSVTQKEIRKIQADLEWRIHDLLNKNEPRHRKILQEYDSENRLAIKCHIKLREFFNDPDRVKFIEYITKLKIPAGLEKESRIIHSAEAILDLKGKFSVKDKSWNQDWEKLKGDDAYLKWDFLAFTENPHILMQSLNAIEDLQKNVQMTKLVEAKDLDNQLAEYETSLSTLSDRIKKGNSKEAVILKGEWKESEEAKRRDVKAMQELINEDIEENRRLVGAMLRGQEKEIRDINNLLDEATAQPKQDPELNSTSMPELDTDLDADKGGIQGIYHQLHQIVTIKGKIRWYSFHDIAGAFELVSEALKKHAESVSEDKSGPLAHGMLFWRPVVAEKAEQLDRGKEKGRADEIKKNVENYAYEKLLAELALPPAKDYRRAILETLATRGNLRMSDHRLISAVIPSNSSRAISKETWLKCESSGDYTPIRDRFKDAIDKDFIGEIGYGQKLLEMQTSGEEEKESKGKKYSEGAASGSGESELQMIFSQIDKANLEGGTMPYGMIKHSLGQTGNLYTNNPSFIETELKTKDDDRKTFEANVTVGFFALKLVDGYLRGYIDPESIQQRLSTQTEGSYKPLCAFEDMINIKVRDPKDPTRSITLFEAWGWIADGYITELGKNQIINFFDTRVAWDSDGNARHIGVDSVNYIRHSSKLASIQEAKEGVNDKMLGNTVKASSFDLYDQATRTHTSSSILNATPNQIKNLFKAATEEIIDARVLQESKRYIDPDEDVFRENTDVRLKRGVDALEVMFTNLSKNQRDPSVFFEASHAYRMLDRETAADTKEEQVEYGRHASKDIKRFNLKQFIKHQLAVAGLKNDRPDDYQKIMTAFAAFEKQNQEKRKISKHTKDTPSGG